MRTATHDEPPREPSGTSRLPIVKLSILTVSFNTQHALAENLRALAPLVELMPHEVWVVDNGSSDDSVAMVRSEFPRVRLIVNESNLGFGAANNQALLRAEGELILFLNSDASMQPAQIKALVARLESDARTGAIGPQLRDADGSIELSWGYDAGLVRAIGEKSMHFLRRTEMPGVEAYIRWRYRRARKVGWVSGACLLTRRDLMERLGGFDPRFFLYMEDVDLCRRIHDAGYHVRFDPAFVARHHRGLSSTATSDARDRVRLEAYRSRLAFFRKHRAPLESMLYRTYLRIVQPRFEIESTRVAFERLLAARRGDGAPD